VVHHASWVGYEEHNNLDEKAWVKKYQALLHSDFIWKDPRVSSSTHLMSYGDKAWVPLIGLIVYISYSPPLVAR
jgi:hypothetical protein